MLLEENVLPYLGFCVHKSAVSCVHKSAFVERVIFLALSARIMHASWEFDNGGYQKWKSGC
jgi:hypothetical protein